MKTFWEIKNKKTKTVTSSSKITHTAETIPKEIIEAAEKITNYAKKQGLIKGWIICGVADKYAYEELLEHSTYNGNYGDI